MKEKWIKRGTVIDPGEAAKIAKTYQVSEKAVEIAAGRGITDFQAFFKGGSIRNGEDMLDMGKTVKKLLEAIQDGRHIRIMGDYDMDGVMSTTILKEGLTDLIRKLGSKAQVSWDIPDRLKDGYGLNTRLVQEAFEDGVEVILTCDNGIAAFEAISLARCLGMSILVTDHHQVPVDETGKEMLVNADTIVDPHRADDPTPFKDICGAVVAYKLVRLLYKTTKMPMPKILLGYAAFATITDVMPLIDENRDIVKQGLPLIRKNPGLDALCRCCKMEDGYTPTSSDIGFFLGPCGNAAGRIGDVKDVMSLLEGKDPKQCEKMALELYALNEKRKGMCSYAEEAARPMADKMVADGNRVLVFYIPNIHEGIIGIVAGRIREAYNLPTFVFTDSEGKLKGSGRSTETWNMYEHLTQAKHLLLTFGGHPAAAGVSVSSMQKLDELRTFLNDNCNIPDEDLVNKIYYDEELSENEMTVSLAEGLSSLEPYGASNEAPVFFLRNIMGKVSCIGSDYQTVRIDVPGGAKIMAFHAGDDVVRRVSARTRIPEDDIRYNRGTEVKVSAIGTVNVNEYQGTKTPQLIATSYVFPR